MALYNIVQIRTLCIKSIHSRKEAMVNLLSSRSNSMMKTITLIPLLISLLGCSGNSINTHGQNSSTPSISSASSSDFTLNKGASIDTAELHIQSPDGIDCAKSLVLATARLTYDSGEIKQMAAYVDAVVNDKKNIPPIPPTLTWVPGNRLNDSQAAGCALALQITNIGKTSVQIPHADIRITMPLHQNTYQYRLIDACKLVICGGRGAGPGPCGNYGVTIHLGVAAQKDTVFSGEVIPFGVDPNGNGCPPLTLTPGNSIELSYNLESPGRNLIYSAIPELTLETSSGSHILQLSQLAGTLVYSDRSQFTCYAWDGQNQAFVKEDSSQLSTNCATSG
jgi:hypothetical protein